MDIDFRFPLDTLDATHVFGCPAIVEGIAEISATVDWQPRDVAAAIMNDGWLCRDHDVTGFIELDIYLDHKFTGEFPSEPLDIHDTAVLMAGNWRPSVGDILSGKSFTLGNSRWRKLIELFDDEFATEIATAAESAAREQDEGLRGIAAEHEMQRRRDAHGLS